MASDPNLKATCAARVQLTIEIDTGSVWGADCPLGQVFDQACRETADRVRHALRPTDVRIIGEPVITAIIAKR